MENSLLILLKRYSVRLDGIPVRSDPDNEGKERIANLATETMLSTKTKIFPKNEPLHLYLLSVTK
jgi:hypothetical protein